MNNEKIAIGEKYLPIGTVVMLKGGRKRCMITGFCSVEEKTPDKMWDYSGCMYPEGFLSSNQTCLFDHTQIEEVFHMGLVDDEEKKFKLTIKAIVEKLNPSANAVQEEQTNSVASSMEMPAPASIAEEAVAASNQTAE